MNKMGEIVIAPTFTGGDYFKEGYACVSTSLDPKNPTFQFIDKKGNVIINKNFKYLTTFKNGLAKVSSSDMKAGYSNGYIDTSGKYVWPWVGFLIQRSNYTKLKSFILNALYAWHKSGLFARKEILWKELSLY